MPLADPPLLPLGTLVDLRRSMPSQAARDKGWRVISYSFKKQKPAGYELMNAVGERTFASRLEAVDVKTQGKESCS